MTALQQAGGRWLEYMPLSAISRAERNPKQHDRDGIRASLARWGVADLPVLDERTGRLVSGHGRLDQVEYLSQLSPADLELATGKPDPPGGIQVDPETGEWMLPVVRGWASSTDAEAGAYLLAANQLTIAGPWDEHALSDLLRDLNNADPYLLELTGFPDDDLAQLLAGQPVTPQPPAVGGMDKAPPDDFPEYDDATIPTEHTCPACGYQFSGGKGGG